MSSLARGEYPQEAGSERKLRDPEERGDEDKYFHVDTVRYKHTLYKHTDWPECRCSSWGWVSRAVLWRLRIPSSLWLSPSRWCADTRTDPDSSGTTQTEGQRGLWKTGNHCLKSNTKRVTSSLAKRVSNGNMQCFTSNKAMSMYFFDHTGAAQQAVNTTLTVLWISSFKSLIH